MTSVSRPLSGTARGRIVTAWANAIGVLPADTRKDEWVFVERTDLEAVVVVSVDGRGLVAAPPKVLNALREASPDLLLDADALAKILPGADPIGSADLLFTENSPQPSPVVATVTESARVAAMREGVSTPEWEESGIEETERRWATLAAAGSPAAFAGFTRWRSELAQMAVLASPQHRGAGFAYAAAAVATQEALGENLIPQWRSRQGNEASRRLAQRLGFTQLGVQAAVALNQVPEA